MPQSKAAKKAIRQSVRQRAHNTMHKIRMKRLLKQARVLDREKIRDLLPKIYKVLDKAAKEKVIKKNTAARRKSRITKALSKQKK